MTDQIKDPFAGAEDDDEFDTPQTSYLEFKALDGRLLVIDVVKLGTKKGTDGDYGYAECNVVVVDGQPIPEFVPTIPGVVMSMHISATAVYNELERHFRNKPGKPYLCRPDGFTNKLKQVVMGVRKHEITEADKAAARGPWRQYQAKALG